MAIEVVTANLVRIDGYFVSLGDTSEPDMFDVMNDEHQRQFAPKQRPGDVIISPLQTPGLTVFDPLNAAYQQLPRFISLAQRAANERAVSYRDFKVGASAYALDDEGLRVGYLFGANYKPAPESEKYCAELDIVKKARLLNFNRIVALAVFGPSEFADVDPFPSPTLHPCSVCRDMLTNDPLFADNPLVVTANAAGGTELFLKDDLLRLHTV